MRCKACDAILKGYEACSKDDDGVFMDLCRGCKNVSYQAMERDTFKHDILNEQETDGTKYPTDGMV